MEPHLQLKNKHVGSSFLHTVPHRWELRRLCFWWVMFSFINIGITKENFDFWDSSSMSTNVWFWIGSLSKTFPTLDRRTWKVIVNVAEGDTEDINQAVKAARKAIDADLGQRWPLEFMDHSHLQCGHWSVRERRSLKKWNIY